MMRPLVLLLLATLLAGCATLSPAPSTFVIVRHAEKADDGSRDPPLAAAGRARAQALAESLAGMPVVAVYATPLQRARQTAAPTAHMHGLPVTTYPAGQPPAEFAARLREAHPHGTVLVVGHSNTAPAIAAALCNCTVEPMAEHEYGRRMTVRIEHDGDITLLSAPLPVP